MSSNNEDSLLRAYARLTSLRQNVPDGAVSERYAREYHEVLNNLQALGLDVGEFRIPEADIVRRVTSRSYSAFGGGGSTQYTDEKYVDRSLILAKLDAILAYFDLKYTKKPERMGFRKPEPKG